MTNFLLVGVCIIAGILLRKAKLLPVDAHKSINTWIIYVALPAVAFKYLPHIHWTSELLLPALVPILVWSIGYLVIHFYAKTTSLDKASVGGLKLITGLSNTSFVGFPLVMAYYGAEHIGIAVISDQATFLIFATVGVVVAISASGEGQAVTAKLVLNKMFKFPPLIGALAALTLPHFISIEPVEPVFNMVAATIAPMALLSIGLQLQFSGWLDEIKTISVVLLCKLILAPALVFSLIWSLELNGIIAQVSNFEMAMPSLLSAAVLATEYNLNPRLINLIVGICIMMGFITTAGWFFILKAIA